MTQRRKRALVFLIASALGGGILVAACSRHADLRDEREVSFIDPTHELDAGDIPSLDAGLGTDAYQGCMERPLGDCVGVNDFPCDFVHWVNTTAESCQAATGCVTNGWLEVKMGADGCVNDVGMDQPNQAMVACLLAELGAVRCPCGVTETQLFLGLANSGVCAGEP